MNDLCTMKPVESIKVHCMYINLEGEIIKTTGSEMPVRDSVIRKNEFLRIVHDNTLKDDMARYLFDSMMLYHVHHTCEDIEQLLTCPEDAVVAFADCLCEINMHRDLVLPDAVDVFGDVHELFIMYRERPSCRSITGTTGKSRRVRIQVPQGGRTRRNVL